MIELKYKTLDEIVRLFLERKYLNKRATVDNDWWFASELGTCMRKQFLRRLGLVPKAKEWRISFLAEEGNAVHTWIQNAMKTMGCLIAVEEKIRVPELRYSGRLDLIIDLGMPDKPYLSLIDIKTQRSEAFWKRKKAPAKDKIQMFQKMQLASYFFFAKERYKDLKEARLYYLDRGGGVRDEYVFKFNKDMYEKVLTELNTLNKYWEEQKLPPCSNSFVCGDFCKHYKGELAMVDKGELSLEELKKIIKK